MDENSVLGHEYFMGKALQLAQQAFKEDEIPIGALVVHQNRIIGKGYNQTERLVDVTAHAEMLAITSAAQFLGSKFLDPFWVASVDVCRSFKITSHVIEEAPIVNPS